MNLPLIIPSRMTAPSISGNELYCTDSFNHAMQCCNIWCSNPGCSYIKAIFYHHMAANANVQKSSHDSCNTCQRFNIYASQHSANCRNMLCSLKFCKNNRIIDEFSPLPLRGLFSGNAVRQEICFSTESHLTATSASTDTTSASTDTTSAATSATTSATSTTSATTSTTSAATSSKADAAKKRRL